MSNQLVDVPLGLELEFVDGQHIHHDYSQLPCRQVVRQLAEAHLSLVNAGGGIKARATSSAHRGAIACFTEALHITGHIGGLAELTEEHFAATMSSLQHRQQEQAIKTVLLRFADDHPQVLASEIIDHCQVPGAWTPPSAYHPSPPFTPAEATRIEAACKAEIAAVEARMALGQQLLATGADPILSEHGWDSDANLLWLFSDMGPIDAKALATRCQVSPGQLIDRGNAARGGRKITELRQLLFPTSADLVPFLLLLGLTTGISPEGITSVKTTDWIPAGDGRVRVSWNKPRGGGREADTFSTKSQWSPGKLLDRVASLTAALRQHTPETVRQQLWLSFAFTSSQVVATYHWSSPLRQFVARHDLQDDNGVALVLHRNRLRKTFYARLDRRYHGAVNLIAGVNQTAQVAADHYLSAQGETELLRQVIEATQSHLVQRAQMARQVTVLTDADITELADPDDAARRLGMEVDRAKRLLNSDEEDVFAAKCKDFYNSPHAQPGQPCGAAVWECLFCPLAVVTPSKLPNLLGLLDHIDRAYERMVTSDWQARYAAARRALTEQILPRFSDEVIAAARAQAIQAKIYLPPEEEI